jgi:hypothetical protein
MAHGPTVKTGGKMRGEEPESAHQQKNQENPAQFHRLKTSKVVSCQFSVKPDRGTIPDS